MDYTNTKLYGDIAQTKEEKDTFFRTSNSGYGGKFFHKVRIKLKQAMQHRIPFLLSMTTSIDNIMLFISTTP